MNINLLSLRRARGKCMHTTTSRSVRLCLVMLEMTDFQIEYWIYPPSILRRSRRGFFLSNQIKFREIIIQLSRLARWIVSIRLCNWFHSNFSLCTRQMTDVWLNVRHIWGPAHNSWEREMEDFTEYETRNECATYFEFCTFSKFVVEIKI